MFSFATGTRTLQLQGHVLDTDRDMGTDVDRDFGMNTDKDREMDRNTDQ
jgi:hypothetical protein